MVSINSPIHPNVTAWGADRDGASPRSPPSSPRRTASGPSGAVSEDRFEVAPTAPNARSGRADARASALATGINGWPTDRALEAPVKWKSQRPAGARETWWPMLSWSLSSSGDPLQNLWADGGPCSKLDAISGKRSQEYQSRHRSRSARDVLQALGNLVGLPGFNRWDAFNAGHCNQVAACFALFETPEREVHRRTPEGDEITFTPRDVAGLMALCLDDLVCDPDKNEGFGFSYVGHRYFEPPRGANVDNLTDPTHPDYSPFNDPEDPYPHEVIDGVIRGWMESENLKVIADRKPGVALDNFCFDACQLRQLRAPPPGFDPSAVPSGGTVKFYEISLQRQAAPDESRTPRCWVHESSDGQTVSGWIHPPQGNLLKRTWSYVFGDQVHQQPPDFYWIPHLKPEYAAGAPWEGLAKRTNPEVDMREVWRLYKDATVGPRARAELEARWSQLRSAQEAATADAQRSGGAHQE